MAFTVNQESGGHSGRALHQYSKHSSSLRSNDIPQLLHYQHRNWYFHHNTTTKTPTNLAREHINNDRQERADNIGLPVTSKDDVRSAGEKGDKEELGDVPRSISAPSRNVDKLLPPLPIIDGVGRLSSRLIQECIVAEMARLLPTIWEGGEGAAMSPSAGDETAVNESVSNGLASKFSRLTCNNNEVSMNPFATNGEDDDKEGGEYSKDKGEWYPTGRLIPTAHIDQIASTTLFMTTTTCLKALRTIGYSQRRIIYCPR
jgi:hypothetical protein